MRSISHPQGRIINHRPPNAVDLEAVFAACLETGTAVETNGLPDRIDLSAELVREAIRAGVAHHVLDRRALGARPREHAPRGRDRAARLGDRRGRAQHAPARGDPGAVEPTRANERGPNVV